jgi:drug/metabolite transporter (DMT)-like permease
MDRQYRAYLYALSAVLMWSTVASAFKLSLVYLSPVALLFYASLFSCAALLLVVVCQNKLILLRRANLGEWRKGLMFGFLNPFLYYLLLFKAYDLLPAQQAQPINYTWAVTLSLLSVPLLGHRISRMELISILISYSGVYIIATKGDIGSFSFTNPGGLILALASTLVWALYWLFNTKDGRDPVVGLLMNFICARPVAGIVLLLTGEASFVSWQGLAGACYVGCCEMGFAFILWLLAMKSTRSTIKIANLIFFSPFLSLIFIHYLVGEDILGSSVIGLSFIVAGVILQSTLTRSRRKDPAGSS